MIEMELVGVRVELPSNSPIVLLREQGGQQRLLPIFIGGAEAKAIALALEDVVPPRPMTHDLIKDMLSTVGITAGQVVISDLRNKTFFAELHLTGPSGDHVVSSRPSDAIALAARTAAPIFAAENVLDEAGYVEQPETSEEPEQQQVLDEFRDFIDTVSPEDFE